MDMNTLSGLFGSLYAVPTATDANHPGDAGSANVSFLAAVRKMQAENPATSSSQPLEVALKEKYPHFSYHVLDGIGEEWEQEDYPHHLLFQQKLAPEERKESTTPFAESSIPLVPGSKAVVIPSSVQERLLQDPGYAAVVQKRVEDWLDRTGENRLDCCQCLVIGGDGEVAYGCSFVRSEEAPDVWEKRIAVAEECNPNREPLQPFLDSASARIRFQMMHNKREF